VTYAVEGRGEAKPPRIRPLPRPQRPGGPGVVRGGPQRHSSPPEGDRVPPV